MKWYIRLILAICISFMFNIFKTYSSNLVLVVGTLIALPFVYLGLYVGEGIFEKENVEKGVK